MSIYSTLVYLILHSILPNCMTIWSIESILTKAEIKVFLRQVKLISDIIAEQYNKTPMIICIVSLFCPSDEMEYKSTILKQPKAPI